MEQFLCVCMKTWIKAFVTSWLPSCTATFLWKPSEGKPGPLTAVPHSGRPSKKKVDEVTRWHRSSLANSGEGGQVKELCNLKCKHLMSLFLPAVFFLKSTNVTHLTLKQRRPRSPPTSIQRLEPTTLQSRWSVPPVLHPAQKTCHWSLSHGCKTQRFFRRR